MRDEARIQAAIELFDQMLEGSRPLDMCVAQYFKARRYAGSKDRRAITDLLYGWVRRTGKLSWCATQMGLDFTGRTVALIDHYHAENDPTLLFTGEKFAPAPLTDLEKNALESLANKALGPYPDWATHEYPEWLEEDLHNSLGTDLSDVLKALSEKAPLDLRINRLHPHADQALDIVKEEIDDIKPTPYSPMGLRTRSALKIKGIKSYKDGLVDIQDESAQIASLLLEPKGQEVVIDFCAGAGGKTLAIGAEMNNQGTLYALDISKRRLDKMRPRLMRAGLNNVIIQPLQSENDVWLKQFEGRADRIFIDAPCSGTGTWRRQPEARWKLTEENLRDYQGRQERLLQQAAFLLKPGGRLVYATCSLLSCENEQQVGKFLSHHPDFKALHLNEIWAVHSDTSLVMTGSDLKLRPDTHGCDGFYAVVLEKHP